MGIVLFDRMAELHLRPAALDDAMAIAELVERARTEGFKDVLPESSLQGSIAWRINAVASDLKDASRVTVVATSGPDIVGVCVYDPWMRSDPPGPSDISEIKDLYVDPSTWRSGAGRRLLAASVEDLRERGSREVVVATFAGAERALAFYSSAGFVKDPNWHLVNVYNQQPMVRFRLPLSEHS